MAEWLNEMWCVCMVGYFSAFKGKEILARAVTWMNLEDFKQSEVGRTQESERCVTAHVGTT